VSLRARLDRRVRISPKVVSGPELDGEPLGDYDVVALCNVPRLSIEQWARLETFVDRGGGLMVFSGDLVSIENYNRYGYADGRGLLPGEIRRPAESTDDGDSAAYFDGKNLSHRIVADFRDQPASGLFLARVERYLRVESAPHRSQVVMRYTNGDTALMASDFGRGRVLLFTTTANMDWTNLPAKGDYVSLMLNAIAYLAPRHGDHRNVLVGQFVREPLLPNEVALPIRVTTVGGSVTEGRLVPFDDALAFEYGPTDRAGVLTALIGSRVVAFSANVDPQESDLAVVDEVGFRKVLDRPVHVVDNPEAVAAVPAAVRSSELSSFLLGLVVILLLVEMGMALWFGHEVRTTRRAATARDGVY